MFHDPKFWLAVTFVTFIALIIKLAGVKIVKSIEEKAKMIAEEILAAKEMRERAADLLIKAKKYQEDSENYAAKLLEDAENEAKEFAAEATKMMESEIAKKTAASMERIKMEEMIAVREIKNRIVNSAINNLSSNISQDLKTPDHEKLVNKAISDFEKVIH
jgi:F-type H+-transporting ATPase subunit b